MKTTKKFLALFLVLGMLIVSLAVPASANSGTATYPNTANFSWGINGHGAFGSYGSMSVENQMALAAKLGVKLYRVDIAAVSQLDRIDDIVMAANSYGMDVMLCMTVDMPNADTVLTADTSKITKDFKSIARHFKTGDFGRVKYFEIFNETEDACKIDSGKDASLEASYDSAKITAMANAMKAARTAIKGQISDAKIVINYGYLHDPYLKLLAAAGLDFDVIDLHWYTGMEDDFDNGLYYALNRLDAVDSLKDKPVILGEIGVELSSQDIHGSSVLTDELEAIMDKAYKSDKVIGAIFYELLDYGSGYDFGFADTTGAPKEIYTSVQTLIGGNNDITAGTYTRSASFPTGNTAPRRVTYDTGKNITMPASTNYISFDKHYDASDTYELIEFDTYIESDTSGPVTFQFGFKFGNEEGQYCRRVTYSGTNQWIHDAWEIPYIATVGFATGGFKTSDICGMYVEPIDSNTVINLANIKFVNRFPNRNNTYNTVADEGYQKLRATSTVADHLSNRPIDASEAEYVELDVWVESGSVLGNIGFRSRYDESKKLCASIGAVQSGSWVHKVIPMSNFANYGGTVDKTYLTGFFIENGNCSKYSFCNISFTKFAPDAKNVFNSPLETNASVSFNNTSDGWADSSRVSFPTTDITKYDYIEFDVYAEKGVSTENRGGYCLVKLGSNNSNCYAQKAYGSSNMPIPYGTWKHVVLPLTSDVFDNYDATLTAINNIYIGGVAPRQTIYLRNICFTKFAPEANNIFNNPVSVDAKIDFHNTSSGWDAMNSRISFTPVDISGYDYVEFDAYTEPGTTDSKGYFQIRFGSDNSNVYGQNGYGSNQPIQHNTWTHMVYALNKDIIGLSGTPDLTNIKNVHIIGVAPGQTVHIRNISFTKFAPEVRNVYYAPANTGINIDFNNTTGEWTASSRTSFNAINTTKYQYVEYDVYVENVTSTSSTGYFQLRLGSSNDTAYGYLSSNTNGYGPVGSVPVGTWKHVVSSLSDFATLQNNPDLTAINNAYIAGVAPGQKVYMRNICFTMETEPPQIVWGDATGNGEVDILDLIRLKKAIANGDTIDNCDFDGTGESDAEDLTYLKQFILGIIDSLDPEDINA